MTNDTTRAYAEYSKRFAEDEERKRQENFARRRADPEFVKYGVDECAVSGGGHRFIAYNTDDGRYYCEYCNAEALPEHVKEWEEAAKK